MMGSTGPRAGDAAVRNGLYFLPLGGTSEIGMNLYCYAVDGQWLMVDLGITFGDDTTPGVDVLMPDPTFIEARRDHLRGLVLTHGHEDHFGAIQYLWPRLRCPIYCTPFTAAFLRLKLREVDWAGEVPIIEVPLSGTLDLDPFQIEFVSMTHSIPEPNALAIRTRYGTVLHSGDWKLDPEPLLGETADAEALRRLGEEGVLALVCDSTNVFEAGLTGSESEVKDSLTEVIGRRTGRVAVTCFSTNVARLKSIAAAAHANGRHCALVGRSLWRVVEAAGRTGYLEGIAEPFLNDEEAGYLPEDRVVMVCTGSQGEPRSALARISNDDHPHIVLGAGDTVIFSAREIPGNERAIGRIQNALIRHGVEVLTPDDAEPGKPLHVSGHPSRDELISLYQWVRPKIAIPMHGEQRHLREHARLATTCQVPLTLVPEDGDLIRLTDGPSADIVERVPAGRIARDGTRLASLDTVGLRDRQRFIHNGAAVATLVLTNGGSLATDPKLTLMGLADGPDLDTLTRDTVDEIRSALKKLDGPQRQNDQAVREATRGAVRRSLRAFSGKKPRTDVHLIRV